MKIRKTFVPILLDDYIELHLKANSGTDRAELREALEYAINAYRSGTLCECGDPIWIVGSAQAGLACFTCITGEALPDNDYEIVAD